MEIMKLKDVKQKRFFFIFQIVKWTWILVTNCVLNTAILEILLLFYPSVCLASCWQRTSFSPFAGFRYGYVLLQIDLYKGFSLKWLFKRKKKKESSVYPHLLLYTFSFAKGKYLQRENASGSLSKFIALNVRRQRFFYQNKIDKK